MGLYGSTDFRITQDSLLVHRIGLGGYGLRLDVTVIGNTGPFLKKIDPTLVMPIGITAREDFLNPDFAVVVGDEEASEDRPCGSFDYISAAELTTDSVVRAIHDSLEWFVVQHSRTLVFVHAGVVGWNSKAIVIPGRSAAGKSTLVAELVAQGATYYSDEYCLLDSAGRVHPYRRPLALRTQDGRPLRKIPRAELGGMDEPPSLEVGMVISTQFARNSVWNPIYLTVGQGLLVLLNNSLGIRSHPERVLPAIRGATQGATVALGDRGDARITARLILDSCE